MSLPSIASRIATLIGAGPRQVEAAVRLLDEGATVPFIARYRKEMTGALDDGQLRTLAEQLGYLRELEERRAVVLASIEEQGRLDEGLRAAIEAAETKARLEDLYLPFKPKRRTRAQIAREAGLEALADALLAEPQRSPEEHAAGHVDAARGIADVDAALDGARAILLERWSEQAELVGELREWLYRDGRLRARVVPGKEQQGVKYRDYFDYSDRLPTMPSHRTLALFRGRAEGILELELEPSLSGGTNAPQADPDAALEQAHRHAAGQIARHAGMADHGRPANAWLLESARLCWRGKLQPRLALDLFGRVRERAEQEAIAIFGSNLKDLLLSPPAGRKAVIGLDPGLRTGIKLAVVDATGKLLATDTIYPLPPRREHTQAAETLARLVEAHDARLLAIGNGTGSRETEAFVAELAAARPELKLSRMMVSEAGASVYSASELAAREFPGLDVSLRGAVSIARRLQDPLAELVKIDPKAIGVGQYQHDVNQVKLGQRLDAVVEDCVNAVGVELNTASAPLLARVAGLGPGQAELLVRHRDEHGPFADRMSLLQVPRLGPKTFIQCAGFLRIHDGRETLDASAVHPEAYPVVDRIARHCQLEVRQLIGNGAVLARLDPAAFIDDNFGLPTVRDILRELEKPGRDPRPEFRSARFDSAVRSMADLKPGMWLEGVVSNVAAFGAFVDIGVHQDGLVHVSALAGRYVKDPREVVRAGQIVRVRVLEIDVPRKRIALSMRPEEPAAERPARPQARAASKPASRPQAQAQAQARPRPEAASPSKPAPAGKRPAPREERRPQTRPAAPAALGALGSALAAALKDKDRR